MEKKLIKEYRHFNIQHSKPDFKISPLKSPDLEEEERTPKLFHY